MLKKPNKPSLISGTLFVHAKKGFGFVSPDHPEKYPFDIFIPASDLKGALDGDHVLVSLFPGRSREDKRKGTIRQVVSRGKSSLVGTIVSLINSTTALVCVTTLGPEVPIKAKLIPKRSYKIGDRLLLETPEWQEKPESKETPPLEMIEFIGNISNAKSDFPVVKAEYNLIEEFPEDALKEASIFSQKHISHALRSRRDLRDLLCFTIDSATAKDFDDAVSLTYDNNDNYILGVHIADVSHYVTPNSALDKEAAKRCNSTYFPGKVIPMLPSALSDNLCSLKPNVDRLAVSVFMTFTKSGHLSDYQVFRSVIRSKYRMTYDEVDDIIENNHPHPISNTLHAMANLSRRFSELREERGCIRLVLPSFTMSLDNLQEPTDLIETRQTLAHKLIEEFMLKANEVIAYHIAHQDITLPFRIHEPPNSENLLSFNETAQAMGFEIVMTPTQEPNYQYLLQEVSAGHPLETILHSQFVRSMKTASYSTENKGHYGLQLDYYTHFTSPIRRYIDLVVHRLLFHPMSIDSSHLEQIVKTCSTQERVSAKAEFSLENMKKTRFLKKFLDEQPDTAYKAFVITSSIEGISFTVPQFCQEGFISTAQLPKEYVLKKKSSTTELPPELRPGATIQVKLASVNLLTQVISWSLIPQQLGKTPKKKTRRKTKTETPKTRKKKVVADTSEVDENITKSV
ncbi:ribonuclease R family protein [Chlamydia ibidis]|uniref:ribonuclease R family protein n=1 Tax=Chlamydia ibidis TaxID=1405396 RepID=UPI000686B852|nr:ribonuclease R family protein [Chlamydia ibidis]